MPNTQPRFSRADSTRYKSEAKVSRDLVQRMIAGDRHAESDACQRYHGDMMSTARAFTNNRFDAEDRVNTAWAIALPKLRAGELINTSALRAFLRGVVRTVARSELRRQTWLTTSDDSEYLEQAVVDPLTPYDVVKSEAALARAVDMIEQLPVERDRDVLYEEYFRNTSRDRLCAAYDVTQLQLSRWLSRARKRLRDSVCDWEELGLTGG